MKYITLICSICLMALFACNNEPPELDKSERRMMDSIYTHKTRGLNAKWDSICQVYQDSLVQKITDSIIEKRKKEIDALSH